MTPEVWGTDSGPECHACGATLWVYRPAGDDTIRALCVTCHAHVSIALDVRPGLTVRDIRETHATSPVLP